MVDMPSYRLDEKVVVITGSARGIGFETARIMAGFGAKVIVSDLDQKACDEAAEKITEEGGIAKGITCDVSDDSQRKNLIAKTVETFGKIDILVNNAGIGGKPIKLIDMNEEYYDKFMDVDVKAVYFMSQAVALQMKEQGCEKGTHPYRIINLSSDAAIKSPIGDTVYGSAKAAVAHLTRIMANELARYGITCNSVSPGYVATEMTKEVRTDEKNVEVVKRMIALRRYAEPKDVASVINFLASDAAGYLTGVNIPIDGGMAIS